MYLTGNYTHFSYTTADGKRVASTVHDGHPNLEYWTVTMPSGKFIPVCAKMQYVFEMYPPLDGQVKRTRTVWHTPGQKPTTITKTALVKEWLSPLTV